MTVSTFLHAADLHLDAPLATLDLAGDAEARARVRRASRDAFTRLIDHALRRHVAFVVIAGDLWDGTWQDVHTGLWFVAQLARLEAAGIEVVFLRGNHDAASEVTPLLRWPGNVHEFETDKAGTIHLERHGVALHGQGFAQRHVSANLAAAYPPPVSGRLNVGVLHTALDGLPGHAPYAPCTVVELAARGYDYWALGHVHGFQVLGEAPWIVFAGCLQGRHANETGPKGAVEVDFAGDRILAVRHVALDVVRWARPVIDLEGAAELEALDDRAGRVLRATASAAGSGIDLVVVRPRFVGRTPLHETLLVEQKPIEARIGGLAAATSPRTVIEAFEWRTEAPRGPAVPLADEAVLALLAALDDVSGSAEHRAALLELVRQIAERVPLEVLAHLRAGPLADLFEGDVAAFLARRRMMARAVLEREARGETVDAAG
ncbi:MAG: metallophosphoesterase family protein [Pseudomonadota bacterium]